LIEAHVGPSQVQAFIDGEADLSIEDKRIIAGT
jgi:hypothetical protein